MARFTTDSHRTLAIPVEGGLDTNDYAYVKDPINEFDLDGNGFCAAGHNPKNGRKHGGCRGGRAKHFAINLAAGAGTAAVVAGCIASVACGVAAGAAGVAAITVGTMGAHGAVSSSAERRGRSNQVRWFAGTIRAQVQGSLCAVTIGAGCLKFIYSPRTSWRTFRGAF